MTRTKTILLLGATVLLAGGGLVLAREGMPGHGMHGHGPMAWDLREMMHKNGKVTRAEFDSIMTKHFQQATNGQPVMTLAQFTAEMSVHFREMNDKMFKRLDKDGDGGLTMAEFAAPELKLFDRLDRNHDGVITADEMKPQFHGHGGWGKGKWHGRDGGDDHGRPPHGDDN